MDVEADLSSRPFLVICVLVGVPIIGWLSWRELSSQSRERAVHVPVIDKQSVVFASRTFDPAAPPADMPPLAAGENAECDSDFQANASVGGETRQIDATHATVTITRIKMTLQLNITIWLPAGVTQHVAEHEEGHREISESYYQTADKKAERIAANYMGRRVDISGSDLSAESNQALHEMATEITNEYNKELNPEPAQLLYDTITDHSRNEVVVKDAVAHALKNVSVEWEPPATN